MFLMIRRPPRSTLCRSSAASDVYESQGTDGEDDVVFPLCESLKLAANSAASARTYPRDVVRKYNGPADLQSGAWRYWVGIARGARGARQLLADLNDSSAFRICWPIHWTSGGVYLFSDSSGRSENKKEAQFYNLLTPARQDYEFLSRNAAVKMVKDQVWNFDHLGECEDIPDFGAEEIVASAGNDITVNDLELEGAGAVGARLLAFMEAAVSHPFV